MRFAYAKSTKKLWRCQPSIQRLVNTSKLIITQTTATRTKTTNAAVSIQLKGCQRFIGTLPDKFQTHGVADSLQVLKCR